MSDHMDSPVIRVMTPDDRALVEDFFCADERGERRFFNVDRGNEMTVLRYLDGELPNHLYWIAVDETPDGTKMAGLAFIWDKNTCIPWFGIAVAEGWKGKHLGRRLLGAVREHCEQTGCGGIMLTTAHDNVRGQGLYERCGFERLGEHVNGELFYLLRFPKE